MGEMSNLKKILTNSIKTQCTVRSLKHSHTTHTNVKVCNSLILLQETLNYTKADKTGNRKPTKSII